MRDVEDDYSMDRLDNLGSEYLATYPSLADFLLECFGGCQARLSEDELAAKLAEHVQRTTANLSWSETGEWVTAALSAQTLTQSLYDIGFLGIEQPYGVAYAYDKDYIHANSGALLHHRKEPRTRRVAVLFKRLYFVTRTLRMYHIHPAFRTVLECRQPAEP